ncbi:MAG TPA: hypothetical protein VFG20_06965 [Planctomycetaceae bacterium]|nr:hypothetical protein [Planctomycetaceae bacterium]
MTLSWQHVLPLLAVTGALCAWGSWRDPQHFFPAYLVAYLFWLSITLGCLAIAMLHQVTGGAWGFPIRPFAHASALNIVWMAILFLPLMIDMQTLYIWARPDVIAADELLRRKTRYLNVPFWQIRAAGYFVIWTVLAFLIKSWTAPTSRRSERTVARLGAVGLVLWGLTTTFSSIDWVMSLEPHWASSMFGVLFMGAQAVAGMSFMIVAASRWSRPAGDSVAVSEWHDLGNLLLGFMIFWSYVTLMQFLIIWSGNLPEEAGAYTIRAQGVWGWLAILLAVFHFFVPFALLLRRQIKRESPWLARVAGMLLVMRLVDLAWLVLPTFSTTWITWAWLAVSTVAIGAVWLLAFNWQLSRGPWPQTESSLGVT